MYTITYVFIGKTIHFINYTSHFKNKIMTFSYAQDPLPCLPWGFNRNLLNTYGYVPVVPFLKLFTAEIFKGLRRYKDSCIPFSLGEWKCKGWAFGTAKYASRTTSARWRRILPVTLSQPQYPLHLFTQSQRPSNTFRYVCIAHSSSLFLN